MSVRRSVTIFFSAKYVELLLGLVSSLILARLLTPEEFGIYSIAASVVIIGYLFRNFGVGQYIVQVEELNDGILRSAFTVTLGISWSIGLLLIIAAPWLGDYYENSGIATVLRFLSLNFFLLPFGSIADAVLRRNMSFDKLAVINVSAAFTTLVVGVTAAYQGASYLSIAWAANASTVTSIALTLFFRPAGLPWLPGTSHLREVCKFGLKVGMMDLVNRGSDAATELIIGRAQGLFSLGIYSRAYGTFWLFEYAFTQGIRPVILPYLSKAKHEKADLGEIYITIVKFTSIFLLPFFVFLGLNAHDIINVMYGDQWTAAGSILQVLCIAGLFFAPTIFFEQLMIAQGRPGQGLRYIVISQVVRVLALVLWVGISLEAAAAALIVWALVKVALVFSMARQHFSLRPVSFIKALWPAILTAFFLALAIWGMTNATSTWEVPLLRLVAIGLCAAITWFASIFAFDHPITVEVRNLIIRIRGGVPEKDQFD
ncbi:Lipopolysaccharide biosynthesis protein WzxC [Halioglobus japonicus]|nr:Lipopolysaccharide biosynthesis protein WzxC [Halioglobus japonicus]